MSIERAFDEREEPGRYVIIEDDENHSKRPSYIPPEFGGKIPEELEGETASWTTGRGLMLNVESTEALIRAQELFGDLRISGVLEEMRIDPYAEKAESNKGHQIRTAVLCLLANQELPKHAAANSEIIAIAASLHDLGKQAEDASKVFDSDKKYPEGHPNWKTIRKHPLKSAEVAMRMPGITTMKIRRQIARAIEQHHEKRDGSGYPYGLKENQICKEARIMTPADIIDAIGSKRPYKEILPPREAIKAITENPGLFFVEPVQAIKALYGRSGVFYRHRDSDRP